MQWIRHWAAGTMVACTLAAGVSGCGGSSSNSDNDDSNGASDGSGDNGTSDNGTSSGSGGTGSGNNASSGNGTGGLAMGDPVPADAYAEEAASVVCEWLTPCCGALGLSVTEAGCAAALETQFAADYAAADPDNYTYDPELAGDCFATAREIYSDLSCDLSMGPADVDPAADQICDRVFTGKLEPGAPCASEIECARAPGESVECTDLDSDATVCVVERRAAEGESCYWTCTEQGGGYFCSGAGSETPAVQGQCYTNDQLYCTDGVCARQPTLGESCAANATCHEGYCLNDICTPAGDAGDPCQVATECNPDLYCDGTACATKKPEGAACEDSTECQSGSCDYDEGVCTGTSGGDFAIALLCAVASGQL